MSHPLVIVGSGLAGYTTAREFRKLDASTPLVIISRDAGDFYSKPQLSNALAAGKVPAQLASQTAAQMASQLDADVRTRAEVTALSPQDGTVTVDGTPLAYAKLVLALGADPLRLSLEGDAAGTVMSVNDLQDYRGFCDALAGARRVAIIGAGLIGCEFANDLCAAGFQVQVVGNGALPMGHVLPEPAARSLKEGLAGAGVQWHLDTTAIAVDHWDGGLRLRLENGANLEVDTVLSAVGLRPRTRLAGAAGLTVNRGIVTDRYLRTSAENIYAIGDCAEVDGQVLPFVMPIMQGARALARTLAGEPTAVHYPPMPVVVKTPAKPVVFSPPPKGSAGEWRCETTNDGERCLFRNGQGQLLGFALTAGATAERQALVKELAAV